MVFGTRTADRGGAPQASSDKRRHRNCFQTRPLQAFPKSNFSWGQRSVDAINLAYIFNYIDLHAQRHGFDPKGIISEVRVHAGAKFGHTGCWSIAKMLSEFTPELQRLIAKLTARHVQILHQEIFNNHGKGNSIKEFRKNEKKWNSFVSLIDLTVMKTLLTARLPVTLSSMQLS